jgi:hypothetical protein
LAPAYSPDLDQVVGEEETMFSPRFLYAVGALLSLVALALFAVGYVPQIVQSFTTATITWEFDPNLGALLTSLVSGTVLTALGIPEDDGRFDLGGRAARLAGGRASDPADWQKAVGYAYLVTYGLVGLAALLLVFLPPLSPGDPPDSTVTLGAIFGGALIAGARNFWLTPPPTP